MIPEIGKKLKIATFDIETSGLDANWEEILVTAIKPLDCRAKVFRVDSSLNPDKLSDKWVIEKTIQELNKFDVIVTWYGSRFDFPFLNSRAAKYGLLPPVKNYRRDLWIYSRNYFKMSSNKLVVVHKFIFGESQKTMITEEIKRACTRRETWAIDFVTEHCRIDVKETEDLFYVLGRFFPEKMRK